VADGDASGPGTRKARNLAYNPACTISVKLPGIDLTLDGTATRVTEPAILERARGPIERKYSEVL